MDSLGFLFSDFLKLCGMGSLRPLVFIVSIGAFRSVLGTPICFALAFSFGLLRVSGMGSDEISHLINLQVISPDYVHYIVGELLVGLISAIPCVISIAVVGTMGRLVSTLSGMNEIEVKSISDESSSLPLENVLSLLCIAIALSGGYYKLLLAELFSAKAVGYLEFNYEQVAEVISRLIQQVFSLAVSGFLPLALCLVFIEVMFAIVSRSFPKITASEFSSPCKLLASLTLLDWVVSRFLILA